MMFTPGQDDDVLLILPFVLVIIQFYFITKILRQTPFIIRQSVRFLFQSDRFPLINLLFFL